MTDNTTSIVEISSKPPSFKADFEGEKKRLNAELEKYRTVVVTEETLKADKKLAQELSGKGREYTKICKEKVDEVSKPIIEFKTAMTELSSICKNVSTLISDQVKKYEAKRLEDFGVLLAESINKLREDLGVNPEFHRIDAEKSLIKLGSITPKGQPTKGAKDSLTSMVNEELSLQKTVDYRLLQLESESYKAGLRSPLVRLNVESFLFADDQDYNDGLVKVISSEVERQAIADKKIEAEKEAIRIKAEQDAIEKQQRLAQEEADRLAALQPKEDIPVHEPEIQLADNVAAPPEYQDDFQNATGNEYDQYAQQEMAKPVLNYQPVQQQAPVQADKVECTVTATFKVKVPMNMPVENITRALTKKLSAAGISSVASISAVKG